MNPCKKGYMQKNMLKFIRGKIVCTLEDALISKDTAKIHFYPSENIPPCVSEDISPRQWKPCNAFDLASTSMALEMCEPPAPLDREKTSAAPTHHYIIHQKYLMEKMNNKRDAPLMRRCQMESN